jgi:hypothetical protein
MQVLKVFVPKPEIKIQFGRTEHRWEDNIGTNIGGI